jgi:hypothetical protein
MPFNKAPTMELCNEMDNLINSWQPDCEADYVYFVLDVKRQDATLNSAQMDLFFDFARHTWHVPRGRSLKKFGRVWRWIRDYMVHTLIALPDGEVWQKHKGNVSGSPFTTVMNSYTALLGAITVACVVWGSDNLDKMAFRSYGDNVLMIVPRVVATNVTIGDLNNVFLDIFGQEYNVEESYRAERLIHEPHMGPKDSASFLSRHFGRGGMVWRPAVETIASMVAPETRSLSDAERYARAVGLMLDNPFDIEATTFLDTILDKLEWEGTMVGSVDEAEFKGWRYKYPFSPTSSGNIVRRMTVWECQALYWMPAEINTGIAWETAEEACLPLKAVRRPRRKLASGCRIRTEQDIAEYYSTCVGNDVFKSIMK